MFTYEMPLLLRIMTRPELVSTLKRAAGVIFDQGGIIRRIDNLGTRDLPYKISVHGTPYRRASRFVFQFVVPPTTIKIIKDEIARDVDVVKYKIYRSEEEKKIIQCTLQEELLPPAYREDVQEMINIGKKKHKPQFEDNTGLDYYPFQK